VTRPAVEREVGKLSSTTRALRRNVLPGLVLVLAIPMVASGIAQAAPYEPNETASQAAGPLSGGTDYRASIEVLDDEDWFFFYTAGQRQMDVFVENTSSDPSCAFLVEVRDEAGDQPSGARQEYPGPNETVHVRWTAPGSQKYLLHVTGTGSSNCNYGDAHSYRFRVDPADAVSTSPPPPPPPPPASPPPPAPVPSETTQPSTDDTSCRQARTSRRLARDKLQSARRALRRARSRPARRRAARQVRTWQRRYRQAGDEVLAEC